MKKTLKRLPAMLLALCALISLAAPVAFAEGAATAADTGYQIPDYGDPVQLGEPLLGELAFSEYLALYTFEGKEYLIVPARAGALYIFSLRDYLDGNDAKGTWIYDQETTNINYPRGIVIDSTGKVYITGDYNSVYIYDFVTGAGSFVNLPTTRAQVRGLAIDENDNVYISLYPNAIDLPAQILKMDTKNGNKISVVYETMDLGNTLNCAYADGYIYTSGPRRSTVNGMEIHKVNVATGKLEGKIAFENTRNVWYLSYVDGVVFAGHSANAGDGMMAVDTATMKEIDIGTDRWLMGMVTKPRDGKSYMVVSGIGLQEYDLATRKVTPVDGMNSVNLNIRTQDPFIEVNRGSMSGMCIMTLASTGAVPYFFSLEGKGTLLEEELVEEAMSSANIRSVNPGVPGLLTLDPEAALGTPAAEVAVYIGGYLSSRVGSYKPDLEDEYRLETPYTNGHAQTDSMVIYKDKLYSGCYSGAYLVEYDPATDTVTELVHGLKKDYNQLRIHDVTAGDDKIFFATVPDSGHIGGAIGWYDLITGELYVERNVVFEQNIINLQYDEKEKLLYGSSTARGDVNSVWTGEEAKMLVYDVANRKVLGNFSVRSSENPNSDMVFDLENGDAIPDYISGMGYDPSTGKRWGLVGRTLFTFSYDRSKNTLSIHEEWAPESGGRFCIQSSGLPFWGRDILFDGKGYMYIYLDTLGIYRFKVSDLTENSAMVLDATRIYNIGADGNFYYGHGTYLYMVALDRISIVKSMIDGVDPADRQGALDTLKAYDALTDEERTQIDETYIQKMNALKGASDIYVKSKAREAEAAIDAIGAVTVTSGGDLLNARMKCDALTDEDKSAISNYQTLLDAEAAYSRISAKTQWSGNSSIELIFGRGYNKNMGTTTTLQKVTYDHVTNGLWEYAMGPESVNDAKFHTGENIHVNFGKLGNNYLGIRFKVNEPGLYTVTMNTRACTGVIGGVYVYSTAGFTKEELYVLIDAEIGIRKPYIEGYIGSVDYTVEGNSTIGKWNCEEAGEYILVFNMLESKTGNYGQTRSVTFTKQDPTPDSTVELAKSRINAIGKVTLNSKAAINEARVTYDALTDAQRELIYAPALEAAEAAYAELLAEENNKNSDDMVAVSLVEVQINAIGAVNVGSEGAIKAARQAYDSLTAEQKKQVSNVKVLTDAEAAYAQLAGQSGTGENNVITVVLIVVGAALVVAGVIVAVVLLRKKKAVKGQKTLAEEETPTTEDTLEQ